MNTVVILDNIRSMENVGSIFRTCDAFGVKRIYLAGITPTPTDRFGRKNNKLLKSSLGAEDFVKWEKIENLKNLIKKLKKERYKIIAVEQDNRAIDYRSLKNSKLLSSSSKLALVFGNEVEGINKESLKLCDAIIEIPMKGKKESLNVAVSVGVVISNIL